MKGTWHTGDCGSGGAAAVIGVGAVAVVIYLAAQAVEAIPWWIWAGVVIVVVAGIAGGVRLIYLLHRPPPAAIQETWHARAEATRRDRPALPTAPLSVSETPPTAVLPPVQIHHHWHVVNPAEIAAILLSSKNHQKGNDQCSG
jgi:hypothetical protein